LPQTFGEEWREGRDHFGRGNEALVERPVGVELFGRLLVGRPKAVAGAADVPVRQGVDELGDRGAGGEVVVLVHALDDRGASAIEFTEDPAVELAARP
jgi:hypothetical protein